MNGNNSVRLIKEDVGRGSRHGKDLRRDGLAVAGNPNGAGRRPTGGILLMRLPGSFKVCNRPFQRVLNDCFPARFGQPGQCAMDQRERFSEMNFCIEQIIIDRVVFEIGFG